MTAEESSTDCYCQVSTMTKHCIVIAAVAYAIGCSGGQESEGLSGRELRTFKCNSFNTANGALYRSTGGNRDYDDDVISVFADSKGWVWAGTVTGLAVYDGKRWTSRTFQATRLPPGASTFLNSFQITESGPESIVEGPPGTIWFGGPCGIWQFRDDHYTEIGSVSQIGYIHAMAVDQNGSLWVVDKSSVQRYEDETWSTVLCPYIGKPASYEAPGLRGIAIETTGNVWIGGTVYGVPKEPWEHEGSIWAVDQGRKKRNGGPPMAPLFRFDGKIWRAFGPPYGLDVKWANPELDQQGRIRAATPKGYFMFDGRTWERLTKEPDVTVGKRWILKERASGYAELLFREGERLVEVRPTDNRTGEVLDVRSQHIRSFSVAEDRNTGCLWLGTSHGLYKICPD